MFFAEKCNKTTKKVVVYSKHSVYLQRRTIKKG